MTEKLKLNKERFFSSDPVQCKLAVELYESIEKLPIVSPHGHVDPKLFVDEQGSFGTPTEMLIIPDHYVFRMLYSQGIPLERLGVPRQDGGLVENDHRKIWQVFAENYYLFRGTPSGTWLNHEFREVFGIKKILCKDTAQEIYDQIAEKLASKKFTPRKIFEKFNIEVLCTTDAASDPLNHHKAIRESGWKGVILPTFRPDAVVNLEAPKWKQNLEELSAITGIAINCYKSFIAALEDRRRYFKQMGAKATDHAALTAYTAPLTDHEAEALFQRALKDKKQPEDAVRFGGHMLMQMARMSIEDGLVMQLHVGASRNHNAFIFERFGLDKGADIPVQVEFTRNMAPLLNAYGNDPRLGLILFSLDESVYAREMATLAGHYPALRIGPPWWFHDSLNGMQRYFDQVMETAGIYNTSGFNDDTRAFASIPARHDVWRRAAANWLAGLVARHIISLRDSLEMAYDLAYRLPKLAYRLD